MKFQIHLVVLGMLLVACGGAATDTTAAAQEATTTTAANADTTAAEDQTTTTGATAMSGVHVADTEVGAALVGPDEMTLYVFTSDTGGESTCYDACAELWPPVPGETEIGSELDASIFGTTTRDDGGEQLTVNDMPLYWYEPDEAPGDAKGQGFNGVWFVVDGDGEIVEGSASADASTDDTIDYDYGYGG